MWEVIVRKFFLDIESRNREATGRNLDGDKFPFSYVETWWFRESIYQKHHTVKQKLRCYKRYGLTFSVHWKYIH